MKTNIDFISKRFYAITLSLILIFGGLIYFIISGGFTFGIDFEGGTMVQLRFAKKVAISDIRQVLTGVNLEDASIQTLSEAYGTTFGSAGQDAATHSDIAIRAKSNIGTIINALSQTLNPEGKRGIIVVPDTDNPNILLIKSAGDIAYSQLRKEVEQLGFVNALSLSDEENVFKLDIESKLGEVSRVIVDALRQDLDPDVEIVSIDMVGPQVGKDLRSQAIKATFWVLIGILIYISWRFKFKFAIGAIVALLHDVLITLAMFVIFHKPITLSVVAAILTIIGYSLNDTIVVFDRVRENLKFNRKSPLKDILNRSINQTLARTLLTSLTTLIVVFVLFLFGGDVIHNFAFALLIGIIVGTYSSIFVATPVYYDWEMTFFGAKKKKKA